MSDVVVTVPKWFWPELIKEGDNAGEPPTGEEWIFYLRTKPGIKTGERVYVVAHGKLRGFSPLVRWSENPPGLIRGSGAVAVTIAEPVKGFQGFQYRWWRREDEIPFPDWQTP